jgi:hypothetical protein
MDVKPCRHCGKKMIKAVSWPHFQVDIATAFWWCGCGHFEVIERIGVLHADDGRLRAVWETMNGEGA